MAPHVTLSAAGTGLRLLATLASMTSEQEHVLEDSFRKVLDEALPLLDAKYSHTTRQGAAEAELQPAEAVSTALAAVAAACKAVRMNGIVSTNDEMDDIPTENLRFLMLEFWRGQLLEKEVDPSKRLPALLGARASYLGFLQQQQRLGLLPREEASLVGDDLIDEDEAVKHDPAQQRVYKVSRVKRRQMLEGSLQAFDWRNTYMSAVSGEDGIGSAEAVTGGEDEHRKRALDAIQVASMASVDALGFIKQEIPLLKMMAAQRGSSSTGAAAGAGGDARLSDAEARRQRERESSRDAAFAPDRPGLVRRLLACAVSLDVSYRMIFTGCHAICARLECHTRDHQSQLVQGWVRPATHVTGRICRQRASSSRKTDS